MVRGSALPNYSRTAAKNAAPSNDRIATLDCPNLSAAAEVEPGPSEGFGLAVGLELEVELRELVAFVLAAAASFWNILMLLISKYALS